MKIVSYKVFEFDELGKNEKLKAINQEIEFILETMTEDSIFYNSVMKAEKMLTPWFAGEYILEDHKEIILKSCREYLYFKNGKIIPPFYISQ